MRNSACVIDAARLCQTCPIILCQCSSTGEGRCHVNTASASPLDHGECWVRLHIGEGLALDAQGQQLVDDLSRHAHLKQGRVGHDEGALAAGSDRRDDTPHSQHIELATPAILSCGSMTRHNSVPVLFYQCTELLLISLLLCKHCRTHCPFSSARPRSRLPRLK